MIRADSRTPSLTVQLALVAMTHQIQIGRSTILNQHTGEWSIVGIHQGSSYLPESSGVCPAVRGSAHHVRTVSFHENLCDTLAFLLVVSIVWGLYSAGSGSPIVRTGLSESWPLPLQNPKKNFRFSVLQLWIAKYTPWLSNILPCGWNIHPWLSNILPGVENILPWLSNILPAVEIYTPDSAVYSLRSPLRGVYDCMQCLWSTHAP